MKLTPDEVAWSDQLHAQATDVLDSLITSARGDMDRHKAEGDILGEAGDVATLADGLHDVISRNPHSRTPSAVLALAIYRLAKDQS